MRNYKKLNNLIGWGVWLIATVVYFLTIEPTASWWDCGEYIATSYKLQVGHPPGAPFFQLLARIFSLFALGDSSKVALMINGMSALSSSFTVLFLFWSITILAKKAVMLGGEMTSPKMIAIFGSGVVGALAYTFSDSFWFSAVEGEVYAMSALFTALVFWAILRWEEEEEQPHSARWLLLIAYLVGLSIGVHMLNLLAIPAIVFVFYFKKYQPTLKGMLAAGVISIVLLSVVMYVIIPEIANLFAHTEMLFVNTFGLPFNSGTIFLAIILLANVVMFVKATKNASTKMTNITIGLAVVLFLLILAESNSAGAFFLRLLFGGIVAGGIYLLRYQKAQLNTIALSLAFLLIGYSSFLVIIIRANANTPVNENNPQDAIGLLSYLNREQYGNWPLFQGPYYNSPVIDYEDGNPVYVRDEAKGKYVIADDRRGVNPVYHPDFTTIFPRMWSNSKSIHINEYKRWGKVKGVPIRFTNEQGESEVIQKPTFGENLRYFFRYQLGFMYLRYFMWNFSGRQNDIQGHGEVENGNWITGINSLDAKRLGNQHNLPPRMQNPGNNKFYMLPLLLGFIGLFFQFNRDYRNGIVVSLLFIMTGIAIIVFLNQHPYQPRERDYAYAGSFYAFAIWIGIGVLGIFNALKKLMNHNLSAIVSTIVPLILVPGIMAREGWDDHDRSGKYAALDFAIQYLESCEPNAIIFTNGDNDTFPLWYAQEVEGIRTDIRVVNYMLASGEWYIHQKMRMVYDSPPLPFTISKKNYDKGKNNYIPYLNRINKTTELKEIIDFIASDDPRTKFPMQDGSSINYLPTKDLKITIDRDDLLKRGIVKEKDAHRIPDEISWTVKQNILYKNDLMLLDLIATNNWERPIYFTSPSSVEGVMDVTKYCHLEGITYRFMPLIAEHYIKGLGGINVERTYNRLVNNASWGRLHEPEVYLDPESRRNIVMPRQNYFRLASALVERKEMDSAVVVLDTCQKYFPNNKIIYDMYALQMIEFYYEAGATNKGNEVADIIYANYEADLEYYASLETYFQEYYQEDVERAFSIIQHISSMARRYGQNDQADKIEASINLLLEKFM
ncbi:MAG: DUF2723 domain-containing protein [Sphingobacteriia bacterium]|nr:DUF2723 domain-containing protein [Sphingobacteriia bacterium]